MGGHPGAGYRGHVGSHGVPAAPPGNRARLPQRPRRRGARVTICARNGAHLEAAADEIRRETDSEVLAVPADLTKAEDIHGIVAATVEQFGGVDVLVNNSGGPALGSFPDLTDDDWRQAF